MRNKKYISLLLLLGVTTAYAQVKTETKSNKANIFASDYVGSITDTDAGKLIEKKQKEEALTPKFGVDEIFLTKDSNAVLEVQNYPMPAYDPKDHCYFPTVDGIVVNGDWDSSGGYKIAVGSNLGSAQILVYDKAGATCVEKGTLLKVYRITVSAQDLISIAQQLKTLVGGIENVEIKIVEQQIYVDGTVLVPKDMRRLLAVLGSAKFKDKPITNLVEISPLSMKLLSEKMEEEIAGGKDRPRDIRVKVVNGRFFLEGTVDKLVDRQTAEKICQSYVSEKYTLDTGGKLEKPSFADLGECVTMVRLRAGAAKDPDAIVSVRVDFVTMNREYLKSFNFRWAPGFGADATSTYTSDTGKFLSTFTGTLGNLFPKLDIAAKRGYARVLKTATIMVRDDVNSAGPGDKPPQATISEKLSIGFTTPGAVANGVQGAPTPGEKEVLTRITVSARSVPQSDKLNLGISAVQTEVKDRPVDGPPTTLSNEIQTEIVVSSGESAALGGLITERREVARGRDPDSDGSIRLFDLDRAHQFTDSKSQFIIFVTPTKLRSTSEGTDTLKRKFRMRK